MDGFYAAYMTGRAGVSMALFVLMKGKLVGVDAGGMKYDGTFEAKSDGTGYRCSVVYIVPPGRTLITGGPILSEARRVPLQFDLPINFSEGAVIGIQTPLGPINAKFEKIRDL